MAQKKLTDEAEEATIIDLTEIVETPQEAPPDDHVIDFNSQLSDLLGNDAGTQTASQPALEKLLEETDDSSDLLDELASMSRPSSGNGAESLDDLLDGIEGLDGDDGLGRKSSAASVSASKDVDALINDLDVPPSGSEAPATDEEEVADLDSLLDSLFSSPAANQVAAASTAPQEPELAPEPVKAMPDRDAASAKASSKTPSPADDLDSLFDELSPPTSAKPSPESLKPTSDELDMLLADIKPEPAAQQDDLDIIDSILDEAMPELLSPAAEKAPLPETAPQAPLMDEPPLLLTDSAVTKPSKPAVTKPSDSAMVAMEEDAIPELISGSASGVSEADIERLKAEIAAQAERLALLEAQQRMQTASVPETPTVADLLTEGTSVADQLASRVQALLMGSVPSLLESERAALRPLLETMQARVAALEVKPAPAMPTAADIAQDVLGQLQSTFQGIAADIASTRETLTQTFGELQARLTVLEERPEPVAPELPPMPELPDFDALTQDILQRIRGELQDVSATTLAVQEHVTQMVDGLSERLGALETTFETQLDERLGTQLDARIEARLSALEAPAMPEVPNAASIAQDVLALVHADMEQMAADAAAKEVAAAQTIATLEAQCFELQTRLEALEHRPSPELILPDLPDASGITQDVLQQVRHEMDKLAAASAARVLREEIAALMGQMD